jgi:hypothetical protein
MNGKGDGTEKDTTEKPVMSFSDPGRYDLAFAAKNVTFSYDADQRTSTVNMYQSSGTSSLVASAANTYDADSDLIDLKYMDASSNTLAAYHWVYDTDSRVSDEYSLKDSAAATTYSDGYTTWAHTTFGYDHDGELTGASYANFARANKGVRNRKQRFLTPLTWPL